METSSTQRAFIWTMLVLSTDSIRTSLAVSILPLYNSYVLGRRASMFAKSDYATYSWVGGVYADDVGQPFDV